MTDMETTAFEGRVHHVQVQERGMSTPRGGPWAGHEAEGARRKHGQQPYYGSHRNEQGRGAKSDRLRIGGFA